ncbi:MAG TPA: hypothetical protein VN228_04085 [Pyrinomonadaceae bacterium]|nr:hypothetical protein [Pyrinomonadaceae bacterium]
MRIKPTREKAPGARRGERGAALVTTLMLSTLLLLAGGALIVKTAGSVGVAYDATSEMQAYYAAEAGLQATLNVMRGNDENAAGDLATFRNAVDLNGGNLGAWLAYNGNNVVPVGPYGYRIQVTDPDATPAGTEPSRLRITSTGFGLRGSVRRLELLLDRSTFTFTANSTLLMRGAEDCSDMPDFSIGQSNAKKYNGNDGAGVKASLPVFGTTCGGNHTQASDTVTGSKPDTVTAAAEKVANIDHDDLMPWLQDADDARAMLLELAAMAESNDRYFTGNPSDFGSAAEPKFTFVDGDADLKDGAGLLVVTGTLSMSGNANFNGIILVLGDGEMTRNGGGNGDILGAVVVAKFARTWPPEENDQEHPFLAPTFQTNGGGNSNVQYHSTHVANALNSLGIRVAGVQET